MKQVANLLACTFISIIFLASCKKETPQPSDMNHLPVANAGRDKCIVLPVSSAILKGSGESRGGFIVSFNWTKLSGPAPFHILNPHNPVTEVELLIEGEYVFELTITDDKGISSKDIMSVLVSITDPGCGAWDY